MAIETIYLDLKLDNSGVNSRYFTTKTIDEYVLSRQLLTSNQSGVSVNFQGVSTAQSIYVECQFSSTVSLNSTTLRLESNGFFVLHLTSMSSVTLTNRQTTATNLFTVAIMGT